MNRPGIDLSQPSAFWDRLGRQHADELSKFGIENFKRTVNLRYFNWCLFGLFAHQLLPLAFNWLKRPNLKMLSARVANNNEGPKELALDAISARVYAMVCAMLYLRVQREDPRHILDTYIEPRFGNPFLIEAFGKQFTQDACNSVHEFYSSTREATPVAGNTMIEIGAGYGRLGHLFLTLIPGLKYWIVDIPPALNVSQAYLTETLDRKVFGYRPFKHFDEVRDEVMQADICFFKPDQVPALPAKSADLVVCISNLHEMSREQINFYYEQIDRLCRGFFYTKQWTKSIATENGFSIRRDEYPTRVSWSQVYNERHAIQSWFFHALYRIH